METKDKVNYGILTTLSLIVAAMGGEIYLTEDQFENAYICTANEDIGFFEHFSSTMKTGYWLDENGEEQSKACYTGYWVKLKEYAESNNIDINILLNNQGDYINSTPSNAKKYKCDTIGCTEVS